MRKAAWIWVVVLTAAAPVLAEEVIHFTNGTAMAIRSHTVDEDGMIHADLGGDSFIAFPAYQVESIGEAGASVRLEPSRRGNSGGSRPMVAASSRDAGRATARPSARLAAQQQASNRVRITPPVTRDANGLAVTRPLSTSTNPHKRNFSLTGRGSIVNSARGRQPGGGRLGSTPVGRRQMIQSSSSGSTQPRSSRRRLAGLQQAGK